MRIASVYYNLISAQNVFINSILLFLKDNKNLYYYCDTLKEEILIQNSTENELINLEINTNNSLYPSFDDFIIDNCTRKCFDNNFSRIDINYRNLEYNFDKIEMELGKILLTGKKKFKDEQNFVVYGFEGYHGSNSSIILEFNNIYEQEKISDEDKRNLINKIKKFDDYKTILFSIQMLFFYIKKNNFPPEHKIYNNVIKEIENKKIFDLDEKCKYLFKDTNYKIKNLLSIYELIELLSYHQIINNINIELKKPVENNIKDKINQYFNNNRLITKQILSNAIRKFFSRYLTGQRDDQELKENENLMIMLRYKEEIWDKNLFNNDKFDEEFDILQEEFNEIKLYNIINFFIALDGEKELIDYKYYDEINNYGLYADRY